MNNFRRTNSVEISTDDVLGKFSPFLRCSDVVNSLLTGIEQLATTHQL